MKEPKSTKVRRGVTPASTTLAPLDRPFFDLKATEPHFLKETGRTFEQSQSTVLDALQSKEHTFQDALLEPPSEYEPLSDDAIINQGQRIRQRLSYIAQNRTVPVESNDASYGVPVDDFVSSQRLRLRLHNLASVVGQEPLRSITVVHSFIPAEVLEGPGELGFSPEHLVSDFLYTFWRAFAESGFTFVRLSGWLELALIENPTDDKGDCLQDQWLFRGRDFFGIPDVPQRSWSLHLHCYGLARRAGRWATAREITKALEPYFPYRNARLTREVDLKNTADENIGRIGRYRSKLMGDVEQSREVPSSDEIAVNVRFWSTCITQSRDFTICEDWPEIGPRRPKPLDDPDLMKCISDAWDDAERAWTFESPYLSKGDQESKP
jgi:hypothetical protein